MAARREAVAWLLARIDADGEPIGARKRNGWARLPWALSVCGEVEAGQQVLSWAAREQLAGDQGFTPGVARGTDRFGAYPLAHLAIGAWLLERPEVALDCMEALRKRQDPATGGLPIDPPQDRASDLCDLLSTAQAGQAAIITGQRDVADLALLWIEELCRQQPADAGSQFYSFRRGAALLTDPPTPLAWLAVTDFAKPRQSYYTAGMAAVFLVAFAQDRGTSSPLESAARLLHFNIVGCNEQFDDPQSVQVCKFGWGAAELYKATGDASLLPQVARMTRWFIANQSDDGSWAPSAFLVPAPDEVDRLAKTAEHVMELSALIAALVAARGNGQVPS